MPLKRLFRHLAGLAWLVFARAAHACTVCDSRTAHHVRAGIFDGHFLHTLFLVAAPFPCFALLAGALYAAMPDLAMPETEAAATSPASFANATSLNCEASA